MFVDVIPLKNYTLVFTLENGNIQKIFDMKPYLEKGDFTKLRDWELFKTAKLDYLEGVEWEYKNLSLSKNTITTKML